MERFFIDLTSVKDREQLYDRLNAVLPLPEWCGRNLDALYDAFTGEMHDVRIFFRGIIWIHRMRTDAAEKTAREREIP